MLRIIVSVSNDLYTDQRVLKVCHSLTEAGYSVLLVGRCYNDSPVLPELPFATKRLALFFRRGVFFYAEWHVRLFLFLLFQKVDGLHSNDLDTLLPTYWMSKIKKKPLVYDTHEYFTGVPEIQHKKMVKKVWVTIENYIFPRLKWVFTVNDSIAHLYATQFQQSLQVVRNIPTQKQVIASISKQELQLPAHKNIIILQGNGINVQRGAEEAVLSMQFVPDALLVIIGDGDVIASLQQLTESYHLQDKILFLPRLPYTTMMQYTQVADIGLSLDKSTNINYQYSLPNKLFDYIKAGIALVISDLIEPRRIIEQYKVGIVISKHTPESIAESINTLLGNPELLQEYKKNSLAAAKELYWEKEIQKMITTYTSIFIK